MTARNNDSPRERTKTLAVEMLNRRPLSEKELRDKLAAKDCADEDIDHVVTLCLDYGFLNDGQYAGMLARYYGAKGYGPGRLRMELRRRGVAEEHWPQAVEQLGNCEATLDRLLEGRLRGKDISDRKEIEKAGAAMFRKGYCWGDIRAAMNRYKESNES